MIKPEEVMRWIKESVSECDYVENVEILNGDSFAVTVNDGSVKRFVFTLSEWSFL